MIKSVIWMIEGVVYREMWSKDLPEVKFSEQSVEISADEYRFIIDRSSFICVSSEHVDKNEDAPNA